MLLVVIILISFFVYISSYIKCSFRRNSIPSLHGIVSDRMIRELNGGDDTPDNDDNDDEQSILIHQINNLDRDYPDFASLKPDDPLFLDMPWPEKSGPEAQAFSKHMQWKRRLSDGERKRWQQWAVYQRTMIKDKFDYSLEDYVYENMLLELKNKAAAGMGKDWETKTWESIASGIVAGESEDVQSVMSAFYAAFNRKSFDDLRVLWLPDDNAELVLPGYDKARGPWAIEKLFRRVVRESKPMGLVSSRPLSVRVDGYIATVVTLETVEESPVNKQLPKRGKGAPSAPAFKSKTKTPRYVLALTLLRKFNWQWRLMLHQAVRVSPDAAALADSVSSPAASSTAVGKKGGKKESLMSPVMRSASVAGLRSELQAEEQRSARSNVVKLGVDGKSLFIDGEAIGVGSLSSKKTAAANGAVLGLDVSESASVTKKTVRALRDVCKAGLISAESKELLLNDVIAHVIDEDTSLVEVAYELLVLGAQTGNEIQDISDFVDECNVIAKRLQETGGDRLAGDGDEDDEDDDEEEDEDDEDDDEDDIVMGRRIGTARKQK